MNLGYLNEQQFNAVTDSYDNNVVTIASAGSGKTSVLTERIGFLIQDMDVKPYHIMAVTFTNKASNEMKERVEKKVGSLDGIFIGTFHSICSLLLRKYGESINLNKKFTIMDDRESKIVLKGILRELEMKDTKDEVDYFYNKISYCKNNCKGPKEVFNSASDQDEKLLAKVYSMYVNTCFKRATLDYNDLISYTIAMCETPYVKEWIKRNIHYILVDEYQDINYAQYCLISKLCINANLFVVGDSKQSIYGFRCSDPKYLENFKDMFPNSKEMYLDRNYRSTKTIVNASNSMIKNNPSNYEINCFTENKDGDKIKVFEAKDIFEEAQIIANQIVKLVGEGNYNYSDIAILYRKNSQSIAIENALVKSSIPYVIFKGTAFFKRAEIMDILSFLKFAANIEDQSSFQRSLSIVQGIGKKTIESIVELANKHSVNCYVALMHFIDLGNNGKIKITKNALNSLVLTVNLYTSIMEDNWKDLGELILYISEQVKYEEKLMKNFEKKEDKDKEAILNKIENIEEFSNIARKMQDENKEMGLEEFVSELSLLSQDDEDNKNQVKLMTIHSSKGLEFENVFVVGCEEDVLPSYLSKDRIEDIQEERRIMYVAITRAKTNLFLSHCMYRTKGSFTNKCDRSRFVDEIDKKYLQEIGSIEINERRRRRQEAPKEEVVEKVIFDNAIDIDFAELEAYCEDF